MTVSPPIEIGDVVEVARFPGQKWVVAAPALNAIPPGRLWYLLRRGHAHVAGDGNLVVLDHPTFTPGQIVTYDFAFDGTATVIADNGAIVRITYTARRQRALDHETPAGIGGETFTIVELDADRARLVGMNM